jgi:hypothetical protein
MELCTKLIELKNEKININLLIDEKININLLIDEIK